ncbi:hypothetical protein CCHR01_15634 [Colletotrichum chrysophilum]|uniref:J domain-containing protein n=1 Tax=Colletotrichum chrysophilum TaxID=1836956 RepID=A0AAD9A5B7_9PEZI|nr:hypothetical protein CCHR01_15634 [Colletotrichum chrysophilum]
MSAHEEAEHERESKKLVVAFERLLINDEPCSFYQLFSLERDATAQDIKKRYLKDLLPWMHENGSYRNRKRVRKNKRKEGEGEEEEEDYIPDPDSFLMAEQIFSCLMNTEQRAKYDALSQKDAEAKVREMESYYFGKVEDAMDFDHGEQLPPHVSNMLNDATQDFLEFINEIDANKWGDDDFITGERGFKPLDDLNQNIKAYYEKENKDDPFDIKYHSIGHVYQAAKQSQNAELKAKLSGGLEKFMKLNNLPDRWTAVAKFKSASGPPPNPGQQPPENANKPTQKPRQTPSQLHEVISNSWVTVSYTSESGVLAKRLTETFFENSDEILAIRPRYSQDVYGNKHLSDQCEFFVGRNNKLSLQKATMFSESIRKQHLIDNFKGYIKTPDEAKALSKMDAPVGMCVKGEGSLDRRPPTYFWCIQEVDGETKHYVFTASALRANVGGPANYNSFLRSAGVIFPERKKLTNSELSLAKLMNRLGLNLADAGMLDESQTELGDSTEANSDDDLFIPSNQQVQRRRLSRRRR